jgi:hypothetical protein
MHYLLKHKMLQFVFKYLFMAPTCFGPFGPSSGSIHWNLAKVIVSLKYQLKYIVKIVAVQCNAAQDTMHTLQTETFIATAL